MQIRKRNRKSSRRASRKSHSRKACRSRTAYRKASRKSCRSARRRMGGAPMTVNQNDYTHPKFNIEFDPDNEVKYQRILDHPDNQFKDRMAPTFADQQMGVYDYVVEFNDIEHSATIKPTAGLSDRLKQRLAELKASD